MAAKNFADGSATLPTNNVTRSELIAWAHRLQYESGTAIRAIDDLDNVTGLIRQTSGTPGAKTAAAVDVDLSGIDLLDSATPAAIRQVIEDSETISSTPFTIDVTKRNSILTHSTTATGTLPAGTYVGQEKKIKLTGAGTGYTVTLSGTFKGFSTLTFGESGGSTGFEAEVSWNGSAWHWIGGTALIA